MENKFIIVADVIVTRKKGKEYLLCKKNDAWYYELPGAHLLDGYDPKEFCKICLKEQLNCNVLGNLELKHTMFYNGGKKIYLTFMCEIKDEIKINKKFYDVYKWCNIDEVKACVNDKLLQTINNILDNKMYSTFVKKNCYIIREETFGCTLFNIVSGNRYYLNKVEYKRLKNKNIVPVDIVDDCKNFDIKTTKIIELDNDIKTVKFAFSDIAFLELTRACNLRCRHCLNNSGIKNKNELTREETLKLISDLADAGIQEIRFTGGEPLLNKNVYEYIKCCTDLGLSTSLGSNGTLVDEKVAMKLKLAGLKRCVISIDGSRDAHDYIRGIGNYDKSMRAIDLLKSYGIDVRINSVIMKENINDVIKFAKNMHKKRNKLFIRRFIESGRGEYLKDNSLSLKDYEEVKKRLSKEIEGKYIDGHYLKEKDVQKTFRIKLPFRVTNCRAGERSFAIMPNGDISPCGFLAAQGYEKIGNVREINNFRRFWNDLQEDKVLFDLRNQMVLLDDKKITCMAYMYRILEKNK